jgi:microcystin-dependent protein
MNRGLHVKGQFIDSVGIISPLIGDIKQSVRQTDFEGWLLCDGGEVPINQYQELYDLIGNTFGTALTEGNFILPNAQGRVLGTATSNTSTQEGLSIRCVGETDGEEEHTLIISELPAHNHGIIDPGHIHGITDIGHSHTYINTPNTQNTDNAFSTEQAADNSQSSQNTSSSTTGITINSAFTGITTANTGNSDPHNIMQPTLFIGNTFIYSGVADSRKQYVCSVEDQTIQPCLLD